MCKSLPRIEWQEKKAIEYKKQLSAIEWKKPYLSIEWKYDTNVIADSDDLKIIETRHYVPKWLSRMEIVDHINTSLKNINNNEKVDQHIPKWMSRIALVEPNNQLCESDDTIDEDDLKIIEVRYHVPKWMSRMDVVEHFNKLPVWMRRIDNTLFDDHIEQNPPIKHEEAIVPWMRKIDILEDSNDKKEYKVPEWLRKIDLFDNVDQEKIKAVPLWLQRIHDDDEHEEKDVNYLASWMRRLDVFREETSDDVFQAYQWMEIMETPSNIEKSTPKMWLKKLSHHQWCNPRSSLTKVCQSMVSVAALIAACDVCACASPNISVPNQIQCNTVSSEKITKKKFLNMSKVDAGKKKRSAMKKNKSWLRRQNTVNTFSMRKRKHAPTKFSGRGGVRGGVRAC